MNELTQFSFNVAAVNEQHVACVLLLDTSGSMAGEPIGNLNRGLKEFKNQTLLDELAKKRIDVALVSFNDTAQVIQDFAPLQEMTTPNLEASGRTAMGAGLELAMDLIEKRKALYREVGTPYFRPWIFLITDGEPTDNFEFATQRIQELEKNKKVMCWAVGVPGYNPNPLKQITDRVIELKDINFLSIFQWLSNSIVAISNSNPHDKPVFSDIPSNAQIVPGSWSN